MSDSAAALDAASLPFTPVNGSLKVLVKNDRTGLTKTTDITIDLDGLGTDTSLGSLAAALNGIDGLSATVTPTGKLSVTSQSADSKFAFSNDTSGVLAAIGLGTFFSGQGASDLSVNQVVVDDPLTFAASTQGFGEGTDNAILLAQFQDLELDSVGGEKLSSLYDRMIGNMTQSSGVARSVADGFRVFEQTLRGQQLGISGVSLDEEAVKLITYQRAYQASARFISVVSDLLEVLVNL